MILALNFLAKSTDSVCSTLPAWLAYVRAGMPPSWAGLVELNDAIYRAKKISSTNLSPRTCNQNMCERAYPRSFCPQFLKGCKKDAKQGCCDPTIAPTFLFLKDLKKDAKKDDVL